VTRTRIEAWTAVAMAWCAGFVDVACYYRLARTYTSHMTGTTASIAEGLGHGDWGDVGKFSCALLSFLAGLVLSATLQHVERRQGIRSAYAGVLAIEILLLAAFIPLSGIRGAPLPLLIFLPAAAMGMQTVTIRQVGRLRVYTTYLTGNLSKFSESVTACFFSDRDRAESFRHAAVTFGLWAAFLAGGWAGISTATAWGAIALLAPMAVLAACIALDLRLPKALGDVPTR
jgi:uncharacterized membrane protein YoaK (UPF0700 family)